MGSVEGDKIEICEGGGAMSHANQVGSGPAADKGPAGTGQEAARVGET